MEGIGGGRGSFIRSFSLSLFVFTSGSTVALGWPVGVGREVCVCVCGGGGGVGEGWW